MKEDTFETFEEDSKTKQSKPEHLLMGYIRKTKSGKALIINISEKSLKEAIAYIGKDGEYYISMVSGLKGVARVANGKQDCTSIVQMQKER